MTNTTKTLASVARLTLSNIPAAAIPSACRSSHFKTLKIIRCSSQRFAGLDKIHAPPLRGSNILRLKWSQMGRSKTCIVEPGTASNQATAVSMFKMAWDMQAVQIKQNITTSFCYYRRRVHLRL